MPDKRIIEKIVKEEYSSILATLIRLLNSFDLAEEVLQDAFESALIHWPKNGIPKQPRSWLIHVAKNQAIDKIRKNKYHADKREYLQQCEPEIEAITEVIEDDQLRLIFTCCHPAISTEAQIALTLKTIVGMTTAEIARAFLQKEKAVAQRIVRVKRKIKDAKIPYRIPDKTDLNERLHVVLKVIYLIFNEGYAAFSGEIAIRQSLTDNAIKILRLLLTLMPDEYEIQALLALCLLQDARKAARIDSEGKLVLLEDQDRTSWHHEQIAEGILRVKTVLKYSQISAYSLQAAIAAVHCEAATAEQTDWHQIRALYVILGKIQPDPIVELNYAVAVSKTDGIEAALNIVESLKNRKQLLDYHLLYTTYAALLSLSGRRIEARKQYKIALTCEVNDMDRELICCRIDSLLIEK